MKYKPAQTHLWLKPYAMRVKTSEQHFKSLWFLGVADTNDVIQKIEKTLNNTHTTTQKLTNNSFRNTKKHPNLCTVAVTVTVLTGTENAVTLC